MKDGNELYNLLRQSTGSETIYRHRLAASFTYTEGVRDFARNAGGGGYWLLDILATEPAIRRHVEEEGFALVLLKVTGREALLTVADDSNAPPIFERKIDYTDCPEAPTTETNPEGAWKFYLEPSLVGDKPVIMCLLPQER